ncbi:FliI/YscN family ATPase [Vulgatibacter sp.]|uniref:FliI/YscN family ATPase n=1 Tax=Vulgatibacter sp. TaxID=1971226 RepID=UPI003569C040
MSLLDLGRLAQALAETEPLPVEGKVRRATGLLIEASLPRVAVGTACEIRTEGRTVAAEVVGFAGGTALLMPLGAMQGICEGCAVVPRSRAADLPVGDGLLGRVVDAAMRPLDGGPVPLLRARVPIHAAPPAAMERRRIAAPLPTGVRAIDGLLTLGEGQRMGILAGAGVGKSVLLGMLARSSAADVIVVGLVGERGREVREFVERDLGAEGLARAVVVVATSDEAPLVRVRAAMSATAVAEHFRSRGRKVLLLLDSLTRVAMAQREIGLAAGEPPTTKGYPPSVFALLPAILERAGNDRGTGSITGLYTVLAEGDDLADPVVDAARSILDGHLALSRKLAGAGHFPAIDPLASVSRVMSDVVPAPHLAAAAAARRILANHAEAADLIDVGAYVAGSNAAVDRAIERIGPLRAFLRQAPDEATPPAQALAQLARVVEGDRA